MMAEDNGFSKFVCRERFVRFPQKKCATDGRTDGPTDQRTDRPSYRDASKNQIRSCVVAVFLLSYFVPGVNYSRHLFSRIIWQHSTWISVTDDSPFLPRSPLKLPSLSTISRRCNLSMPCISIISAMSPPPSSSCGTSGLSGRWQYGAC